MLTAERSSSRRLPGRSCPKAIGSADTYPRTWFPSMLLISAGPGAGCVGSAAAAGAGAAAAAAGPPPCCGSAAAACPRCWSSLPPRRRGRSSRSAGWRTRWRPGSAWWWTACPCSQSRAASAWARSRWRGCRASSASSCCVDSPCSETGRRRSQQTEGRSQGQRGIKGI